MILYSGVLDDVVADLAKTVERLAHIDPARIVSVAAARAARGEWGRLADCVALGLPETPTFEFTYERRWQRIASATPWFIPRNRRVTIGGESMLYVLRFSFPRFLENTPLETVIHELLHVSPRFDGSHAALRHGRWFDRYVRDTAEQWRRRGDPSLVGIMGLDFAELRRRFGAVACHCFRKPFRTPLRFPADREGDWLSHPEARRLGLRIGREAPRPIPMAFDNPAELDLTESDLEWRVFHPHGSRRVAPSLVLPGREDLQ